MLVAVLADAGVERHAHKVVMRKRGFNVVATRKMIAFITTTTTTSLLSTTTATATATYTL